FSHTSSLAGNDTMTFPDFPAEIRAPQGTLAGVSGFQIHFAEHQVFTPGDEVDVLIVMNPAALKSNLTSLKPGGILIADKNSFSERNLQKVGYATDPLLDQELQQRFFVIAAPIRDLTLNALQETGLPKAQAERCKNFFALGISYWLFERDLEPSLQWIAAKFASRPELIQANQMALRAGYHYADTVELIEHRFSIEKANLPPGTYRNINGANALAIGLISAAQLADLPLLYTGYPITPASDILHALARLRQFPVLTYQAEDEIAAMGAAIGAAWGGHIAVTASSGPGIALKMEALGLAIMTELPVVVINAQRGGPSTGLPTKTEQSDLLQAIYGRNGESPLVVLAVDSPADGFACAMEAVRLALHAMTPVMLLTDGYLIMGSEPWRLPALADLKPIPHRQPTDPDSIKEFQPYMRDGDSLARPWIVPGTPGKEHRIGGLEKDAASGNVSYDPDNHEKMVRIRAQKVQNVQQVIPPQTVFGPSGGRLLVLGWGSTAGAIHQAVAQCLQKGQSVAHAQLRYLNPMPANMAGLLDSYDQILIPELNAGQLSVLIRNHFQKPVIEMHKIKGRPFLITEIVDRIQEILQQ
ncbi:MAG: 2-oxoacid:acceptor oxidoreductase subunit alpha, partial [Leptospiraceae bacterium]|nr:2-oxoacid:acceptor oxidoreductase subunit alpha [Leptospiraceae bacterium]